MEYNTTLRINDRLFYDIQEYCNKNDLDMREYLVELIEERHMINKYGDLNEIIPKAIEESKVEAKKRGRPKKKVDEEKKLGLGVVVYETVEGVTGLVDELKDTNEVKDKLSDVTSYKNIDENAEEIITKTEELQKENQRKTSDVTEVKQKPTAKRKRTLKTL